MQVFIFDVETGALPEAEVAEMLAPFEADRVKTGNLRDPAKIQEKLREAEQAHWRDERERAALDALTGRVLAIGLHDVQRGVTEVLGESLGDEDVLLQVFWRIVRGDMGRLNTLVGFNCHQFDLPFLIRRSWKLGVPVPAGLRRGRYWAEEIVDLREWWQMGDRQARGSLDTIARHLGVGAKCGEGKDFARLWEEDRSLAVEYLKNDVRLTLQVAERLGMRW